VKIDLSDNAADFGSLLINRLGSRPFYALAIIVSGVAIILMTLATELHETVDTALLALGVLMILVALVPAIRHMWSTSPQSSDNGS
jgi:uncharacterized membrane protein